MPKRGMSSEQRRRLQGLQKARTERKQLEARIDTLELPEIFEIAKNPNKLSKDGAVRLLQRLDHIGTFTLQEVEFHRARASIRRRLTKLP